MSVLVTGGAGFIGSHLVDALVQSGNHVTVLDDLSVGFRSNLAAAEATGRVRFLEGSICDTDAVQTAMTDCDRVYHLAVQCVRRSLGRPRESHDVNATGTLEVLEAARRFGVRRFIYCSSSEVYGSASSDKLVEDLTICKPMTIYGAAKLTGELYAEAYLRTYGMPTVVVRPFNAYGPRAYQFGTRAEVLPRFAGRILNGLPPVIFGDGSNARDFTYVTEVARGLLAAGETDVAVGEKINIAFGKPITTLELADLTLDSLGRTDLAPEFWPARPGDVQHLHADTSKAESVLGYKAEISFPEGLSLYLAWLQQHYPDTKSLLEEQVANWNMGELVGKPVSQ
jgi:UDP-glucose 4-epimerase